MAILMSICCALVVGKVVHSIVFAIFQYEDVAWGLAFVAGFLTLSFINLWFANHELRTGSGSDKCKRKTHNNRSYRNESRNDSDKVKPRKEAEQRWESYEEKEKRKAEKAEKAKRDSWEELKRRCRKARGWQRYQEPEEMAEKEEMFLRYLFSMLAKLAKADGQVDAEEVHTAEKVFDRFEFANRRRAFCASIFNTAKDDSRSIYWYAEQFGMQVTDFEMCNFVYEILWDIACVDGWLHPAEKEILKNICRHLHIPDSYFDINFRRRMGMFIEGDKRNAKRETKGRGRTWRHPYVSGRSPILEAYEILECEQSATNEELKSAYHKMAKRYHPDLLRANGVPEEMVVKANELMGQVNVAWADICRSRGIK